MLLQCCTQYASKFGRLSSGHTTGKGQFSFQSQRKAMPNNGQTTIFMLAFIFHASKVLLKILQARLQQYMNRVLPDVQVGFRKGRGTRNQIANIRWIIKKAGEFWKNIYFCFTDYVKAFDCVYHNKLWKILKEMGIPDNLNLPPEKSVYRSGSNSLEMDMEQQTGCKLGKEFIKAVYCHPAYLTYMQSISSEMPG